MSSSIDNEAAIKLAKEKERAARKQELNDIGTLLSNASGRRFIWRLLERCSTFGSVFNPDSTHRMSYLSGQQDLGHYIMAEIAEADENLLFKLMKDNKKGDTHVN